MTRDGLRQADLGGSSVTKLMRQRTRFGKEKGEAMRFLIFLSAPARNCPDFGAGRPGSLPGFTNLAILEPHILLVNSPQLLGLRW